MKGWRKAIHRLNHAVFAVALAHAFQLDTDVSKPRLFLTERSTSVAVSWWPGSPTASSMRSAITSGKSVHQGLRSTARRPAVSACRLVALSHLVYHVQCSEAPPEGRWLPYAIYQGDLEDRRPCAGRRSAEYGDSPLPVHRLRRMSPGPPGLWPRSDLGKGSGGRRMQ